MHSKIISLLPNLFVFQVCDFPDFLRGQEREDTLHIALTHYKRKWPKKSLSSISLLNSSRNALLQKRRTSSTGQFSSPMADTKPGCHRKSSLDETILHNFNRMSLHLENSGDTLSSSMPSKLLASQKQNSFPMADLVECEAMSLAQGDTKRQVPLADKCMVGCNFMRKTPSKKKNKHADSKLTDSFVKPQGEDLAPPTRLSRYSNFLPIFCGTYLKNGFAAILLPCGHVTNHKLYSKVNNRIKKKVAFCHHFDYDYV